MSALTELGTAGRDQSRAPNEVDPAIPFDQTKDIVLRFRICEPLLARLVQSDRVFKEFRARFCGKCSPVHFFWGSFDLAVTRFSGRPAPQHPGGVPHLPDAVAREAYSHEVSSLRILAGQRSRCRSADFLLLCLSGACGILLRRKCSPRRRPTTHSLHGICASLRRCPPGRDSRCSTLLEFAAKHVRRGLDPGKLGSRSALVEIKPLLHSRAPHP